MNELRLANEAQSHFEILCGVKPNRRTGSVGNRTAVKYVSSRLQSLGYEVDATRFEVLDYRDEGSSLFFGQNEYQIYSSPYSLGCDFEGELLLAKTFEQLQKLECRGKLLLLREGICSEQLMPKNFVFYNPAHHQRIISLLERKAPAAIITATKSSPDQVGALDPFPLIVDGDFNIPIAYCKDEDGQLIENHVGEEARLSINAQRIPSFSSNIIAKLHPSSVRKLIFTAHIDAYEDSPGASDNASGVVVLLILAEMLSTIGEKFEIEFAILNGEDHYSAAGQMDYIKRFGNEFSRSFLAVNVDDVGYKKGGTSFSFYECTETIVEHVGSVIEEYEEIVEGSPWFNGDHVIFVQHGVPCIAITAGKMPELMRYITHTRNDTPDIIDPRKLIGIAETLNRITLSI